MVDLLIQSASLFALALFVIGVTVHELSEVKHLGSLFENKKAWLIAITISLGLIVCKPPNLEDTVELSDLQIASGVLESRIILKRDPIDNFGSSDSYFILSGSGDDEEYWDFIHCGNGSSISLRCKGKPITVWHKDRVVYQVEMNGQVIYSIENSNHRILMHSFSYLIYYVFVTCYIPIAIFALKPHIEALRRRKMRRDFEETLTNETLDEDHSGKILRRFCKNCGAELGEIVEAHQGNEFMGWEYKQYKFCAKCGLDSDPDIQIKSENEDTSGITGLFIFFFLMVAVPLLLGVVVRGLSEIVKIIFMLLAGIAAIFAVVWLSRKLFHPVCPSCGREYKEAYFCPNCGMNLSTRS